jgi:ankyrin repeat protein
MKNPELMRQLFTAIDEMDMDEISGIITKNKDFNINEHNPDETSVCTPLIASIEINSEELFLYLLKHGASVDIADKNNRMPLSYAASIDNNEYYVNRILTLTQNVNHRDNDGKTALHHAASRGRSIIDLVNYGADVTIADNDGNIPLDIAIRCNHSNVVSQLFYYTLSSAKLNNPKAFLDKYNKNINQDAVILLNRNLIANTKDRFDKIRLLQGALSQSTPFGWYLNNLKTEKAFEAKKLLQSNLGKLLEVTGYNQFIEEQNEPVESPVFNAYQPTAAQTTTEQILKRMDEQDQRILALENEVKRLSEKQGNASNFSI